MRPCSLCERVNRKLVIGNATFVCEDCVMKICRHHMRRADGRILCVDCMKRRKQHFVRRLYNR